jgi:hypothetical protein
MQINCMIHDKHDDALFNDILKDFQILIFLEG